MLNKKTKKIDLGLKGQGHSDLISVHNILPCPNAYMYQCKQRRTNLTLDSKVKVTVTSFWYATLKFFLMHTCTKL